MKHYITFHKILDLFEGYVESNVILNTFGYGNLVDFGKTLQVGMNLMGKRSTQNKSWQRPRNTLRMMLWKNLIRLQEKPLHMDNFIRTCEVFDEITCKTIIDIFESSENKERVDNFGRPNFTQVNMNAEGKYSKFIQVLCYKFVDVLKQYKENLPEYVEWFPHKIYFEELRIKKYDPEHQHANRTCHQIQAHIF